jgi:hypothetical protein
VLARRSPAPGSDGAAHKQPSGRPIAPPVLPPKAFDPPIPRFLPPGKKSSVRRMSMPWAWPPQRTPPTRSGNQPRPCESRDGLEPHRPHLSRVLRVSASGEPPVEDQRPPASAISAVRVLPPKSATGHPPHQRPLDEARRSLPRRATVPERPPMFPCQVTATASPGP